MTITLLLKFMFTSVAMLYEGFFVEDPMIESSYFVHPAGDKSFVKISVVTAISRTRLMLPAIRQPLTFSANYSLSDYVPKMLPIGLMPYGQVHLKVDTIHMLPFQVHTARSLVAVVRVLGKSPGIVSSLEQKIRQHHLPLLTLKNFSNIKVSTAFSLLYFQPSMVTPQLLGGRIPIGVITEVRAVRPLHPGILWTISMVFVVFVMKSMVWLAYKVVVVWGLGWAAKWGGQLVQVAGNCGQNCGASFQIVVKWVGEVFDAARKRAFQIACICCQEVLGALRDIWNSRTFRIVRAAYIWIRCTCALHCTSFQRFVRPCFLPER